MPVGLITGGSRGIGRAIAFELAGMGYDVVLNHVRPADEALGQLVHEIESRGVRCLAVQADIGQAGDREELVAQTKRRFNRCDLLVNNAGVAPAKRVDILETTAESYQRVMDVNLQGPFFLTQMVARWMVEQKRAAPEYGYRIVNISSISAYTSSPSRAEYCISKAGMSMMTALFADRLAAEGVGVFEIRPGITATDMTQTVKDKYDALITEGLTPVRRWGRPEDVAAAVRAIAEGRFDFSPGQVFNVDGGFHLRRL